MFERIRLYLSSEHSCGYLPDRTARSVFVDPEFALNPLRYERLLQQGFRRGGDHVYRPRCVGCSACVPARIPVRDFVRNRTQQRCWARNQDLRLQIRHDLTDEQFRLYQRYLRVRHAGGGMNPEDKTGFHTFLNCGWGGAEFWEFRDETQLVACAVVDRTPKALSAVYTFFDPDSRARSLGTYAVLAQVQAALRNEMDHVYLGYWVAGSAKMDYKKNYRPLEILTAQGWQRLESVEA